MDRLTVDTHRQSFNGVEYVCTQYGAMEAHRMIARLTRTLMPSFTGQSAVDLDRALAGDLEHLGPAVALAFAGLSDEDAQILPLKILSRTQAVLGEGAAKQLVDLGNVSGFDLAFSRSGATMYVVLAWVLKVNFAGFFDGLPGLLTQLGIAPAGANP